MFVTVKKPFPYSADGIGIEKLVAGQEKDIRDDLVPGLVREGWIVDPNSTGKQGGGGGGGPFVPASSVAPFQGQHKGRGRYVVVDANEAPQHDGTLDKDEATVLLHDLKERAAAVSTDDNDETADDLGDSAPDA